MGRKKKVEKRTIMKQSKFPAELTLAARKAGFTPEQIAAYDDAKSLTAALNRIKPSILASAGTIAPPKPPREPVEMMDTSKTLTIPLSPIRALTPLRGDDEQREIEHFINRAGIRRTMFRQEIDRSFEPGENNKYLTEVVIHYRIPKE